MVRPTGCTMNGMRSMQMEAPNMPSGTKPVSIKSRELWAATIDPTTRPATANARKFCSVSTVCEPETSWNTRANTWAMAQNIESAIMAARSVRWRHPKLRRRRATENLTLRSL